MFCKYCGTAIEDNSRFCTNCGAQIENRSRVNQDDVNGGQIGYSKRINDPAFSKFLKSSNRWAFIISIVLAVAAVVGFYIYGEKSSKMDNPEAMHIGLLIGGVYLLISFFSILARKRSKTWDGVVVDKTVKKKSRQDDDSTEHYTEYTVIVRDKRGKKHRLVVENDDTKYNYFKVGDKVRHHAGLKSYEKYDKSHDSIIFCNACDKKCSIYDDVCPRCKCPLLK